MLKKKQIDENSGHEEKNVYKQKREEICAYFTKIRILNSNDFMRIIIIRGRELPKHLLRRECSFNNRGDKGSQVLK